MRARSWIGVAARLLSALVLAGAVGGAAASGVGGAAAGSSGGTSPAGAFAAAPSRAFSFASPAPPAFLRMKAALSHRATAAAPAPADLPARWSWRDQGKVTPARAMGGCDASWAFAAIGAVESLLLIKEGRETDLSEQQIMACVASGRGCGGGWMNEAYRFMRDEGVASETCFPYTSYESVRCLDFSCPPEAVIADWVDIPNDVAALKAALLESPITTVMLVPTDWVNYDGIHCFGDAPATDYALCVLIVGWDDDLCPGGAWICKASVGMLWGDGGFFTVRYGAYGIGDNSQRPIYTPGTRMKGRIDVLADQLGGNRNTWPEPGETVQLLMSVRNGPYAPARTDLNVTGRVLSGRASAPATAWACGPVAPGATADLQPLWTLAIDRTAACGDTVRLELRYADAGQPAGGDTLAVVIGRPAVLIVDDDEGERLETWYEDAVTNARYPFRVWDESRLGPISPDEMRRYKAVVWFEGVMGRLDSDNYFPLASYLAGGGHLFLTGQDIGRWLVEVLGNYYSRLFYQNALLAEYEANSSELFKVTGAVGDSIGDGLSFTIGGPGGSGRQEDPDLIAPITGAQPAFLYAPDLTAGLRSTQNGRLLYLAFGFEAIDQAAARDSVMTRTLRWLAGPPPDITPPRIALLSPRGGERFPAASTQRIRWRGTDAGGILYYLVERSHDGGATWPDRIGYAAATDTTLEWAVGDSLGAAERVRVTAQDAAGLWGETVSGPFSIVEPVPGDLRPLVLLGAVPNPFNGGTEIRCQLGRPADRLTVSVFDTRGRRLRSIAAGPQPAGPLAIPFDGRDRAGRLLPSGLYGFRVEVPGAEATGRFSLVR